MQHEYLSTLLRHGGHDVHTATGGSGALALIHALRPDLVIAGSHLIDMDGDDFRQRVREHPEIAQTPFTYCFDEYNANELRSVTTGIGVSDRPFTSAEPHEILGFIQSGIDLPIAVAQPSYPDASALCDERVANRKLEDKVQRLEQELAEQTQGLEACIAERTAALLEANAQLEALASTDGLTGLKNFRAFQERLEVEFQRSKRYGAAFSLTIIDIDDFKHINDMFGHPAGDRELRTIARLLLEKTRSSDFVARYGGDEFLIIAPETCRNGAVNMAERFRDAMETQPWAHGAVTACFGVSTLTAATGHQRQLLAEADEAMYASKLNGRNHVAHYDDCRKESVASGYHLQVSVEVKSSPPETTSISPEVK